MHHILLVDDQQAELEALSWLILKHTLPLTVAQAPHGEAALAYLQQHHVDILFTDIRMPFMDGLELARQTRALFPEMKIIISSAYSEFEYAQQAIGLGVSHYVLKPIEVADFLSVMKSVIALCDEEHQQKRREELLFKALHTSVAYQIEGSVMPGTNDERNPLVSLDQLLQHIYDAIEQGQDQELERRLDVLLERMSSNRRLSFIDIRLIFTSILKKMYELLRQQDERELLDGFECIARSEQSSQLKDIILSLYRGMARQADTQEEGTRKLIGEVLRIIHSNYSEDIGLDSLARQVYLSPSYLSFLFKKHTGQSLNKYIAAFRMKRAQELLRDTTIKITDVGKMVGYANPSYFNMIFKQHFGLTPLQYREKGGRS